MIIGIATPQDIAYHDVSRFACKAYAEKLGSAICACPDAFAYAHKNGHIYGCFGMYRAHQKSLLIETYICYVFEKISGDHVVDRRLCGEIGTRAVVAGSGFRSADISLALSAILLVYAKAQRLNYIAFTSNRTVHVLACMLGIGLVALGEPNLSQADETFRKNWEAFFRVKQSCFGFTIESVAQCRLTLERLERSGIHSRAALADFA